MHLKANQRLRLSFYASQILVEQTLIAQISKTICLLQKIVDELQKKKPEIRAVNRAGQSLIRQLETADDVEAELDKLSDDYYDVLDQAKDRLKERKENVKKVKEYVEIIEILEVWITEIHEIVTKANTAGNDASAIKDRVKEVQTAQDDFVKYNVKFKVRLRRHCLIFSLFLFSLDSFFYCFLSFLCL